MLEKLKSKWGVETTQQLVIGILVFIVIGLTGAYISTKYDLTYLYKVLIYVLIFEVSFFSVKFYFKIAKYLMKKWEIESDIRYAIIFIVFAITGSSSVRVARPILEFIGINDSLAWYVYWPLRIMIVLPVYQLLLICFGTIAGQFKFFWAFEKKMFGRFIGKK
jgi:hypothetical protein